MMWNFESFRNNTAVITEQGERLSYGELNAHCQNLVEHISKRCLVFSLCKNELGSLVGYVGFLNSEIVPVMLKSDIDEKLFSRLLEAYKPDYVYMPKAEVVRLGFDDVIYSHLDYALVKTKYTNEFELYDDLALLLTTSGSTGSPKLVRQSYKNIVSNTESIVEYLKLGMDEKAITTLPMNYTYGISVINSHLWVGATLILTEKTLMQREFWQQFKEYEATSIAGVPYTYEMLDKLRFFRMQLPSLRSMTQAGGKLAPDLHKKFAEWAGENGKEFIVMYGQTEATARMAYLPFEKSVEKFGSMGIAIPHGKFSLIDIDGNLITEPDVVGELVYEGDNVTLGYAEVGADLAKGDEFAGKLITGDMAKVDEDGYYFVVGRKKRFLKIFGNRVNLDETERLIKEKFCDADCACAGVDDRMYIFVTNDNYKENVASFITKTTGINHVAFKVKVIDSIPKNEVGKKLYKELDKYYD